MTIIQAIQDLGGISIAKLDKCGTRTEWYELPKGLRLNIFRKDSRQGPDEIASQLEQFGITGEADLLDYLRSRKRYYHDSPRNQSSKAGNDNYEMLLAELEQVRKERDRLAHKYETKFVEVRGRFVPYHVPVSDVPF